MRTRSRLASVLLGTALLVGGVVTTSQAAPGTTARTTGVQAWIPFATYRTWAACQAAGSGSANEWKCEQNPNGRWTLYLWV
ncbi:hypothetical protein AB0O01_36025 [Streptomyces sp. NPDC093252]|uniref:hypothetical protein n=1 Tax=Streptomyces sp. NPDC093252 TaxID=3154980 RepID=UPI0034162331